MLLLLLLLDLNSFVTAESEDSRHSLAKRNRRYKVTCARAALSTISWTTPQFLQRPAYYQSVDDVCYGQVSNANCQCDTRTNDVICPQPSVPRTSETWLLWRKYQKVCVDKCLCVALMGYDIRRVPAAPPPPSSSSVAPSVIASTVPAPRPPKRKGAPPGRSQRASSLPPEKQVAREREPGQLGADLGPPGSMLREPMSSASHLASLQKWAETMLGEVQSLSEDVQERRAGAMAVPDEEAESMIQRGMDVMQHGAESWAGLVGGGMLPANVGDGVDWLTCASKMDWDDGNDARLAMGNDGRPSSAQTWQTWP
ncbi:MAG: hypothetical protein M1833_003077 [Piccolia ochrophora]|nr:MAG: hypothetical protein M1833_003077 [Piccolia ochrophora]